MNWKTLFGIKAIGYFYIFGVLVLIINPLNKLILQLDTEYRVYQKI